MISAAAGNRRELSEKEAPEKQCRRLAPSPLTLKLPLQNSECVLRPSKLLLNVTIEKSLGALQVLMLPDDTVANFIKAALAIYQNHKRRPFLNTTDPNCYHLHYSSFTLQSLKPEDKLMNLGSRNFFLRSKPPTSSCFEKKNMAIDSAFPWMVFVPLLL